MTTALKNDVAIQIQNVQVEYMPQIQAATTEGDFVRLQTLMKEMESKINALVEEHTSVPPLVPGMKVAAYHYTSPHSDMDLNQVAYCEEVAMYSKFRSDEKFNELLKTIKETLPSVDIRRDLMKDHLKLDLQLSPKLASVMERCKKALQIKSDVHVYLINSPLMNAYCPPPTETEIYLCLTSSLLEKLNEDELCFVFGHELGHALMNHHEIPLQQMMYSGMPVDPQFMLDIFTHKRAAELTCDRFGLICGLTFENAARTVFKIYYGLSDLVDTSIHSYMKNFGDLNSSLNIAPQDFYSTHPFGPIRLIALQYYGGSEKFHMLKGTTEWTMDSAELEKSLFTLMDVYNANNVTPEMQKCLDRFFAICAISISASDGDVSESEIKKMTEFTESPGLIDEFMRFKTCTPEELQMEIYNIATPMLETCSVSLRMNTMRNLVYVALADGILTETELNILYYCCSNAGVDPGFITTVLNDIKKLA